MSDVEILFVENQCDGEGDYGQVPFLEADLRGVGRDTALVSCGVNLLETLTV